MPEIARKDYRAHAIIFPRQRTDRIGRAIGRTVVDKDEFPRLTGRVHYIADTTV
jgi:hypothetical protein